MHYFAYCISYILWAKWSLMEGALLPSRLLPGFLCETAVKGLIWIGPILLLQKRSDDRWMVRPDSMLQKPFPWYATFIGLCLTVAFLHTAHIVLVGIDVWGIFDPMWIGLSLSAAIIEEIAFRGLFFNRQAADGRVIVPVIINGFLFAIYHFPEFLYGQNLQALLAPRFWLIVIMGMVFSLIFARWKHLGMTIVIHFVWNMLCFWFAVA